MEDKNTIKKYILNIVFVKDKNGEDESDLTHIWYLIVIFKDMNKISSYKLLLYFETEYLKKNVVFNLCI